MILEIALSALFFLFLGFLYVKGYDVVKQHSPEHLPHFYLIMATIRMLLVGTVVALYVFFTEDRTDAIHFAIMALAMYLVTMVVTLILRH
jgi:cytochrome c biogenesis factor